MPPSSTVTHSLSSAPKASSAFLHYSKYPVVMELFNCLSSLRDSESLEGWDLHSHHLSQYQVQD